MRFILFILLICICFPLFAAEDFYQFKSQVDAKRFYTLTSELRCLVCQNQTLAESNASLAIDLREQIYQKIIQGQSNQEITDYLVERYGNFILYQPPFNAMTFLLWFGPILLLLIGIGILFYFIKGNTHARAL